MKKLFEFFSGHAVTGIVLLSVLMILIGLGLLFKPGLILLILRYGLAFGNIGGGLYLLVRMILRAPR